MKLTFLGRGAAFYPQFGNTNAYFEMGGDLYFLDFGESAYEKVVTRLNLRAYQNVYVLLTHLHADHSGSLASLISYNYCVLGRRVQVVHPLPTVRELLKLQGIGDRFYDYHETLPETCPVRAKPVEVKHAEDMRCFGYLLSDGEETIYYSGDSAEFPPVVAKKLLAGELARVYHDVASGPSGSHCYVRRLEEVVPMALRSKVFGMHLDCDYCDTLKALGFSVVETGL
ncbi:MAG: MBL fold metallo-hydrolase [Clostridia bacterium]|nr:MBL fold metallo-hydrolase [Clostridia bacterium]